MEVSEPESLMAKASKKSKGSKGSKRKAPRQPAKRTRRRQPVELAKTSLTIRFRSEFELQRSLEAMAALFGDGGAAARAGLEAVTAIDSCLTVIPAVQIVSRALSPKAFLPTEKLGETYLMSQEREAFKARVVNGVTGAGCQIDDTDVPADEGTTHSAVVLALRQNAHT
jgi:hypothetical protein